MKSSSLIVFVLGSSLLSLVTGVNTQAKEQEAAVMRVEAKCYVELTGGTETISHWKIKPASFNGLPDVIIGEKVNISSGKSNKKKGTIYKVKQCLLAKDEFDSPIARSLDKVMLR